MTFLCEVCLKFQILPDPLICLRTLSLQKPLFVLCRYEDKLPGVDVFICTADPKMEPPSLVINTVLSVLSCNFPSEKLSVYLSDDGGSEITFYALLEASRFSKYWIPFCKKFKVEPRAPEAYFALHSDVHDIKYGQEWLDMKVSTVICETRRTRLMFSLL